MNPIRKIVVFGRLGSEKTFFSFKLHAQTNIALHPLDKDLLYFKLSGKVERENTEFTQIQQSIVDSDSWIIDVNSISS